MAKKKAAPLKPERTKSRAGASPAQDAGRILQFEKLGKVITWKIPAPPYADNANLRSAFIGGFEARVQHVQSSSDEGVPTRFPKDTKSQRAFEDGYHDAANQDGEHLAPAALADSNPEKGKKATS